MITGTCVGTDSGRSVGERICEGTDEAGITASSVAWSHAATEKTKVATAANKRNVILPIATTVWKLACLDHSRRQQLNDESHAFQVSLLPRS